MAITYCVALATLFASAVSVEVTPVEKVIGLIEGLEKEVVDEGKAEASTYDKFACFCKTTTETKSDSVKKGNDNINSLSADIAEKTQNKKDDITERGERKADQEKHSRDLDATNVRCAKEQATYDAAAADLSKAISGLRSAIKAMKDSRPSAASLIAIQSVVKTLSSNAAMAKAPAAMQKGVSALLQQKVDPNDPEYGFHSNDIVELCENLLTDFQGQKEDLDAEYKKTSKACDETKKSLRGEMSSNKDAMDSLDKEIEKLAKEIAEHREDLVQAEGDLKDDELYLKDLTKRCEDRANDYDQRSQMRGNELAALRNALDVLGEKVKDAEGDRAALLQKSGASVTRAQAVDMPKGHSKVSSTAVGKSISFLQGSLVKATAQEFLAGQRTDVAMEMRKNQALDMLRQRSRELGSVMIASLTVRAAADPFLKVKGLIQKLIERLLQESANEATKKGFCDTALSKAKHTRDSRFQDANDLSRELSGLEAKEDELSEEIDKLAKEIKEEEDDLKETTEDREEEKEDNLKAIKVAKDGLAGVTEALMILKSFYSSAAKASASFVQASPVDEDTAGAGFSGSYKGKQGGMKAVFALLETIQSDFDRTMRKTQASEDKAHRDYVEFSQTSKSSIAGKSTKKELDEQDLKTTRTSIEQKMSDLQANTDLLDEALKELETLKPQCIDTGMSYKERVQKREDEMEALKKALCILDADKVEKECQ